MKSADNLIIQETHAKLIMDELRNQVLPLAEKHDIVIKGILFDDYCIQGSEENILNFINELYNERR